jgi:predicted nuclease of predicted toxin-antitoxin system
MRFKIDENLHDDVAALFAAAGHDVHTVYDEGLRGSRDDALMQHCNADGRALVTLDLDFADIRTYSPASHSGIIVLRVASQSRQHVLHVLKPAIALLASEALVGRLWIVAEAGVRIRQ